MKVLHLNTLSEGGAAKALKRLHLNLLDYGVESKVLSLYKLPEGESVANWFSILDEKVSLQEKIIRSIKYRVRKWTDPYYNYSSPLSIFRPEETELVEWADVLNLHWIANFVNYPSFFCHPEILKKPLVWRTPDLFPMRGIVHHDSFINEKNIVLEERAVKLKHDCLSSLDNLHIVATSNWTLREAQQSVILNHAKSYNLIFNAINTIKRVQPDIDSKGSKLFGLKNLIFIAAKIDNPKKGLCTLLKILSQIDMSGWQLIVVGNGQIPKDTFNLPVKFLGGIDQEEKLLEILYSGEIYVTTSEQEAFGQTIIEAMFCEKPVVAFGVGGILDTVLDEETGFLSELNDIEGFKKKLILLMQDEEKRKNFGRNGRVRAEKFFSAQVQTEKYLQCYKDVLNA